MTERLHTPATSSEVGGRLRSVRRRRGLSLDDVEGRSGGRWSASAIGAYERGFRNMSLHRLQELAAFYGVPVADLLGDRDATFTGPPTKVVLQLEVLAEVEAAAPVVRYLDSIITDRGDFNGRILSVRGSDLPAMASLLELDQVRFLELLRSWAAVVEDRGEDGDILLP